MKFLLVSALFLFSFVSIFPSRKNPYDSRGMKFARSFVEAKYKRKIKLWMRCFDLAKENYSFKKATKIDDVLYLFPYFKMEEDNRNVIYDYRAEEVLRLVSFMYFIMNGINCKEVSFPGLCSSNLYKKANLYVKELVPRRGCRENFFIRYIVDSGHIPVEKIIDGRIGLKDLPKFAGKLFKKLNK